MQDISFEGFSIFPNPSADGKISIEVVEDLTDADILIYDSFGRIINERKINKFNKLEPFELPNLQGTTYFVKIISGGYERVRKVLIY